VIFITTGIISYKFGIGSPAGIMGLLLVLVLIFEYTGLITYSDSLPGYAGSIILSIILLGYVIKEGVS
jgi:hypothetical protein